MSLALPWSAPRKATQTIRRILDHAHPALRNLMAMPLGLAGYACVDIGVFQASHVAGWIVTGASLIWVEFLAADEEA